MRALEPMENIDILNHFIELVRKMKVIFFENNKFLKKCRNIIKKET